MKYLFAVIAFFLIPTTAFASYSPNELLSLANTFRIERDLAPLETDLRLTAAAQLVANTLASTETFSHENAWLYLNAVGYQYLYAGQNLARWFKTPRSTVQAWKSSPSHRANLLSPVFTQTGIAVATSTAGRIYAVQYFGRPRF